MAEAFWQYGGGVPRDKDDVVERALNQAAQARKHPSVQTVGAQSRQPAPSPLSTAGFGSHRPSPSATPRHAQSGARPKPSSCLRKRPMTAAERAVCDWVKNTREELQISQSQLAHLLNTDVRSVKRWEGYKCKPRRHLRQWMWTFSEFVKNHGAEAARKRFLRDEEGRYNQPGPAGRLGELLFDTQLRPKPSTEPGGEG